MRLRAFRTDLLYLSFSSCFLLLYQLHWVDPWFRPRDGVLRTQKLRSPLPRPRSCQRFSLLKSGAGQYMLSRPHSGARRHRVVRWHSQLGDLHFPGDSTKGKKKKKLSEDTVCSSMCLPEWRRGCKQEEAWMEEERGSVWAWCGCPLFSAGEVNGMQKYIYIYETELTASV